MKKNIFILLIALAMTLTVNDLFGQSCPPGSSPRTINMNVNGCNYEIDICLTCPGGPVPGIVEIIDFKRLESCNQTWHPGEVMSYITTMLQNPNYINTVLCATATFPPCSENNPVRLIFKENICWNVTKISYFGENYLIHRPCEDSPYCESSYVYCYDVQAGQVIKTALPHSILSGPINCTKTGDQIQLPVDYDVPSECYMYQTPCTE